jgi:hypothetical protein
MGRRAAETDWRFFPTPRMGCASVRRMKEPDLGCGLGVYQVDLRGSVGERRSELVGRASLTCSLGGMLLLMMLAVQTGLGLL